MGRGVFSNSFYPTLPAFHRIVVELWCYTGGVWAKPTWDKLRCRGRCLRSGCRLFVPLAAGCRQVTDLAAQGARFQPSVAIWLLVARYTAAVANHRRCSSWCCRCSSCCRRCCCTLRSLARLVAFSSCCFPSCLAGCSSEGFRRVPAAGTFAVSVALAMLALFVDEVAVHCSMTAHLPTTSAREF